MRRTRLPLAVLALLAVVAAPAAAREWTRTYEVQGRPHVRITTDDFRVEVHTRPSGPVEFRVVYEIHKVGWVSTNPHEPRVDFERTGDEISLEAREPNVIAVFASVQTKSFIELTVPVDADVSVRTGDGAIVCDPLKGNTTLESGDGRIHATGLTGTTVLRSGDGTIEAFDLSGALTARSGDGRIDVDGRFDRLDVNSGDGRVRVVARPGSQVGAGWNLETRDGSLSLRFPRDLKAFLDARTGDGRLLVDLPITLSGSSRRHELAGQLNGGGGPLRMRTADGTLSIAAAD